MNTLTYLSRQFDVLAAATTTPHPTTHNDDQLQRVSTWSTHSFLAPRAPTPKRSSSSPAFTSHLPPPTPPNPTPDTPPAPPRSKPHLESILRQIFFIRVFILVWDNLKAVWTSSVAYIAVYRSPTPTSELKGKARAVDPSVEDATHHSHTYPSPATATHDLDPSSSTASTPRSATPVPNAKKTPFHLLPKTLVLDLDETLIHSTSRPMPSEAGSSIFGLASIGRRNKGAGHTVEVVMGGRSTVYHVYKRPFVDFFLRKVSGWYTLVVFTASMKEYADPVIDWLDAGNGIFTQRLFRDSCTQLPNGSYTKDLSAVEVDLSRVCLVDNSPISYRVNEANGIPIEGWTHDPSDEALLDLLPVLDSLRFTSDVRSVLGLRSAGIHS